MNDYLPAPTLDRDLAAPSSVNIIKVSVLDDPGQLDQFVDEVVARIESRVVDELERRGRRYTPGAF